MKSEMILLLNRYNLDYLMAGYISQSELPKYYSKCKLFLFPTKNDPWGVVANEALASGVPVLTCNAAGVAGDLVKHNVNGYVLPLEEDVWAAHIVKLLRSPQMYARFSANSISNVQSYSFENAASGIVSAINYVVK
jgi:glycosyltransferase involved in cell wall biosynthesis